MDYQGALRFLYSFINYEQGFAKYTGQNYDTGTVRRMLKAAGEGAEGIRVIHIAGTKGKGTTAHYTQALLTAGGCGPVGLFTSPHLKRLNERISVDSVPIADEELAALVTEFAALLTEHQPTFFDALTFLAMIWFSDRGVKWVVLETGLGGRLDSTNFNDTVDLSVITSISYDHTALLGDTLPAIAAEKAGIIKPGCPVLTAAQDDSALEVIAGHARDAGSRLYSVDSICGCAIHHRSWDGAIASFSLSLTGGGDAHYPNTVVAHPGDIFCDNFRLALSAVALTAGIPQMPAVLSAALTRVPGRMELHGRRVYDGAHNDASLSALFDTIRRYGGLEQVRLVIGVLADKELPRIAAVLDAHSDMFTEILITDFPSPRPTGGLKLKNLLNVRRPKVSFTDSPAQIEWKPSEWEVVTGSFYLIEEVKKITGQEALHI